MHWETVASKSEGGGWGEGVKLNESQSETKNTKGVRELLILTLGEYPYEAAVSLT